MAYIKTDWENAPSTRTPVSRDNMNHIENGIYDNSINIGELSNLDTSTKSSLVAAINEAISRANGTILWSNSNPEQAFGPQDMNLSSSDYDELMFLCLYTKSSSGGVITSAKTLKGYGARVIGVSEGGLGYWSRTFNYSTSSKYTASNCISMVSTGGATNNDAIIPLIVVGYKTGINV